MVDALVSNTNDFGRAGSTPALGTELKLSNNGASRVSSSLGKRDASAIASAMIDLLMAETEHKLVKKSRLVIPKPTSKNQRWCIKFWPFVVSKGKHALVRTYKIPEFETFQERKEHGELLCKAIDHRIMRGEVYDPDDVYAEDKFIKRSISTHIELYLKQKSNLRPRSVQGITGAMKKFSNFLKSQKILNYPISEFTNGMAFNYLDYLNDEGLANRSINNYIIYARSFFNHVIDRNPKELQDNPFAKVKTLPVGVGKNLAFVPEQIERLMEIHSSYPDIDFLAKWIYYTLMRTEESSNIKVKHIGMRFPGQIYLSGGESKNHHERNVIIPPPLMRLIEERGILQMSPEYYVFSWYGNIGGHGLKGEIKPGPKKFESKRMGEKYRRWVLDKLEMPKDYTLYSWKHTGVVTAKLNGVSDADIMQQTGHRNYQSYSKYLKSLGLFAKGEYAAKITEI